jgi:hypothetical protein
MNGPPKETRPPAMSPVASDAARVPAKKSQRV